VNNPRKNSGAFGGILYFAVFLCLTGYFVFAAVQGDYGHLRRIQIEAEETELLAQLSDLRSERARIENKTRRLSDQYLDLDLLDEQARKRLGLARIDEVIIR
jgi:cell division protein FtsB